MDINGHRSVSLNSSSSEDLDDIGIDHELVDLDSVVSPKKPHFLDLDAVPPPGFEDNENSNNNVIVAATSTDITTINGGSKKPLQTGKMLASGVTKLGYPGESVKVDKKFERDGEISDYELAACGYTKKEFSGSSLNDSAIKMQTNTCTQPPPEKKKHFLDENPIPPDYMLLDKESREHRSLDRNFERQNEHHEVTQYERKHSLDREGRTRRLKEPSYTLSRFIESDLLLDPSNQIKNQWQMERNLEMQIKYTNIPAEAIQNLGPKVECVYSLLSMLGSHDSVEMSKKFYDLSRTSETCSTLRRSGCIPLLVQMMHSDSDDVVRKRAAMALHNVVNCHPDDKAGRREAKVLRLIEQIMEYCTFLKSLLQSGGEAIADDSDRHPLAAISSLMKVSFDEEHRHSMCQLGALQAIASLVHLDHAAHGPKPDDQCCNSLRRYALMALTNLTFGDGNNKALLCSNKDFMEALVSQLAVAPDDLLQVTASVLRNLSWRADNNMKSVLNEIGTVTALAKAAMKNKNENTLKAILSALWNLSAHCSRNKAEFCAVDGALAFLVDMLSYEGPSKTLKIIENAGGILRNVSSHIAVREDYRKILRQRNCLGILLQQLKSESLTVVSNSCGTLWNLSARFPEDQKFLWDNGAVPMLRSLIHSKHRMISEGSSAALKNLLNFRPGILNQTSLDPIARSMGLKELPSLNVRKQKALENELNPNLAETCDNLDVVTPPKEIKEFLPNTRALKIAPKLPTSRLTRSAVVSKSESRDSIVSTKSDSVYEKIRRGNSAPPQSAENLNNEFQETKTTATSNTFNLCDSKFPKTEESFENQDTELPIDYSAKYNDNDQQQQQQPVKTSPSKEIDSKKELIPPNNEINYSTATYQETDLDQPTDFSLRYAENQADSDSETEKPPRSNQVVNNTNSTPGNEIILVLDDTVKCYRTEDTPYVISNAASVSDLRASKPEEVAPVPRTKRRVTNQVSGSYTPEKPINYCEEGTPGYFSRYESLSSLDESPPQNSISVTAVVAKKKPQTVAEESGLEQQFENVQISSIEPPASASKELTLKINITTEQHDQPVPSTIIQSTDGTAVKVSNNSAQETPLMFSRRSSMDSLVEEEAEPMTADDKSSVVSDFSRLASGVISPSELPDSPTQSMPQSPRRNISSLIYPNPDSQPENNNNQQRQISGPTGKRLRSVFEDDLSRFQVENTPAQFSCATSLSNLSLDDEPKIATDSLDKEMLLMVNSPKDMSPQDNTENVQITEGTCRQENKRESCGFSENEDDGNNDDYLLATCINIGMNRNGSATKIDLKKDNVPADDTLLKYYTEDTPALLSKVGSNSNLSILSIASNKGEIANLSDLSSNASDCGSDLLEQCIREGMQKAQGKNEIEDPISMLRRGGSGVLPPYLVVKDEMSKFVVEDSPCNFSVISALSNLTVGSGIAGPANIKKSTHKNPEILNATKEDPTKSTFNKTHRADDSLSSISIESEDDSNLLSQAIAAGCNRPKSNIGRNPSNPQTIPKRQTFNQSTQEPNDSLSSVDSSDSNDNQAKSLFEQCIRTGMNKQSVVHRKPDKIHKTTALPINTAVNSVTLSPKRSHLPTLANQNQRTPLQMDRERQRERERKDEQLLKECINSGMIRTGTSSRVGASGGNEFPTFSQNKLPVRNQQLQQQRQVTGSSQAAIDAAVLASAAQQQQQLLLAQKQQQQISKNGETTSVVVLEQHHRRETATISQSAPNTAPGVGMRESPDGTSTELRSPQTVSQSSTTVTTASPTPPNSLKTAQLIQHDRHQQIESKFLPEHLSPQQKDSQIKTIGSNMMITNKNIQSSSINLSNDTHILEQSNEYPALKLSSIDFTEVTSANESSSFEMEISNEFLIENDHSEILLNDKDDNVINTVVNNETKSAIVQDKHKDPDLMLKSVERLTHELVSTAEYLRTNSGVSAAYNNFNFIDYDLSEKNTNDSNHSNSNNDTWNENTCPNDISFPSVSISAPIIIASLNDDETTISDVYPNVIQSLDCNGMNDFAEITPTNEMQPFDIPISLTGIQNDLGIEFLTQPNSLETETDTLINDEPDSIVNKLSSGESTSSGIMFKVGGEVKQRPINAARPNQYSSLAPMSIESSLVVATPTIIALEANKLVDKFMQNMTDSTSSLDLDNVRPPSCMDNLSMSGCFETIPIAPQSPQLSRIRNKSLPIGLMARRALGCTSHLTSANGSLESINSSYNLDNVKPPSLMDELLDSMMSVASITSEVVDNSLGMTNYDTAFSDVDEMTTTLQSCMDVTFPIDPLNNDDPNGTPIPSDFSSAESTPRKGGRSSSNLGYINNSNNSSYNNYVTAATAIGGGVKRTLTPKQKRRLIKDRYKTYTVAADFVLRENFGSDKDSEDENPIDMELTDVVADIDEVLKIEIEEKSTPLKRRQENRARFETQVIENESPVEKSTEASLSSVRRRSTNPERFKTRTIVFPVPDSPKNLLINNNGPNLESHTSTEDDSDDMSSIRELTKQFKFITEPEIIHTENFKSVLSKQRTSIPMINQFIRMKLLEEDNNLRTMTIGGSTTTAESDYNSMEGDQNSETESCDQNAMRTTDDEGSPIKKLIIQKTTGTIIKKHQSKSCTDKDSGTDLNFSEDPMTPPETMGAAASTLPNLVKTVRGRKKPPYVSPYKKSVVAGTSTRIISPKSQIFNTTVRTNLSSKNSIKNIQTKKNSQSVVVVSKTHVLLNKANLTNKINALKTGLARPGFGLGSGHKRISVTDKNKNINANTQAHIVKKPSVEPSLPGSGLERQSTFIKDEPSNEKVPIVGSLPTSPTKSSKLPTKSPINGSTTNINTTHNKSSGIPKSPNKTSSVGAVKVRIPIQKSASMGGTNSKAKTNIVPKITNRSNSVNITPSILPEKQRKSMIGIRKLPSVPQRSNSNASLRTAPTMSSGLRTDLPATSPPSRSNSNLTSAKLSQIGSRIAGIWKRVEDGKKSSVSPSASSNNKSNSTINTGNGKPPSGSNHQQTTAKSLIRSSTFDNSPQNTNGTTKKSIVNSVRQRFRN